MLFRRPEKKITTLDDALELSWKLLQKGTKSTLNPFNKPVLTTMDNDTPKARTVILREFSYQNRTLVCHCDARSPKVSQIQKNAKVNWLFYDPKAWLQIRCSGLAIVHTEDDEAERQWKTVRPASRINYSAKNAPGTPIKTPSSGWPEFLKEKAPGMLDKPTARSNFAAIVCRFDEMDWLLLKLSGNMRAAFKWQDGRMEASWLVP